METDRIGKSSTELDKEGHVSDCTARPKIVQLRKETVASSSPSKGKDELALFS
jgi:hypothetical protein